MWNWFWKLIARWPRLETPAYRLRYKHEQRVEARRAKQDVAALKKLEATDPDDPRVQLCNVRGFFDPPPMQMSRATAAKVLEHVRKAEERIRADEAAGVFPPVTAKPTT